MLQNQAILPFSTPSRCLSVSHLAFADDDVIFTNVSRFFVYFDEFSGCILRLNLVIILTNLKAAL